MEKNKVGMILGVVFFIGLTIFINQMVTRSMTEDEKSPQAVPSMPSRGTASSSPSESDLQEVLQPEAQTKPKAVPARRVERKQETPGFQGSGKNVILLQ